MTFWNIREAASEVVPRRFLAGAEKKKGGKGAEGLGRGQNADRRTGSAGTSSPGSGSLSSRGSEISLDFFFSRLGSASASALRLPVGCEH